MATPLFKDVGKNANDLVNKGFLSADKYQWKVELDTTSENGVQFTPNLSQNTAGGIDGELKAKFKTVNATITTSTNLKQELSIEAVSNTSINNIWKPTLTVSTNLDNSVEKAKLKLNNEVRVNNANLVALLEVPVANLLNDVSIKPEQPKVTLSGVGAIPDTGFSVGVETELAGNTGKANSVNVTGAYTKGSLEATLFLRRRATNIVGANYYQRINSTRYLSAAVGTELTHELGSDKAPSITLAATAKPDETSTFKARVSSRGLLGLAVTQQFSGPLSLTFLTDVNLLNLKDANSIQWGVKLSIK